MCQFLASLNESRESYESYFTPKEMFDIWKKQKVSDSSPFPVTRKTYQELDTVTRLKLRNEYLEKQFQEKKSDSKKNQSHFRATKPFTIKLGQVAFSFVRYSFLMYKKTQPLISQGLWKDSLFIWLYNQRLLDDSSNTSRSYCTATLTALESCFLWCSPCFLWLKSVFFRQFGSWYFYLPEFLAPFWHRKGADYTYKLEFLTFSSQEQ